MGKRKLAGRRSVTGTILVISAGYAAFNIIALHPSTQAFPVVLGLLMVAATLTCIATISMHSSAARRPMKGATLRKVRDFRGPKVRRR